MEIKIDKEIPIPERLNGKCKYPFREMQIGDSFYIDDTRPTSLYQAAMNWKKRALVEWKFKVVKIDNGARIWRVK